MNQGKLEVIKQEMARVNIDILGISELNGLEWMNLIQMTIISTTVGKNPLEKWSDHHSQQESEMQYLGTISKMTEWSLFIYKPFSITVIQVYAPTTNAKKAEVEQFYDDLQDLLELTCPFHHRPGEGNGNPLQ